MLDNLLTYIKKHQLDTTPELLLAEFERANQLHNEFKDYLKQHNMQRSEKALDRRKLFVEFYINKHQNEKTFKEMLIELSEMTFNCVSTIEKDFYNNKVT
ncbi:hypothetical protein [Joostella sp.]|uniref:hypothetical protein n=1 Tax=Joostella sp. TaxID=2231138 RepID=UPI003A8F6444